MMASPYDNVPGKIFIGGISPITTQETIQRYFGQFGELYDCVLMQEKTTGKSRGFGFVTYKNSSSVDQVLRTAHALDGKEVDCKMAIPRDQVQFMKEEGDIKTKKIFVGGLPQTLTEEHFRKYFERFGTIEDLVIILDKDTGKSRGFGFVTFNSEKAANRVMQRYFDNKINGKWVECKRAQPKDLTSLTSKRSLNKLSRENLSNLNKQRHQEISNLKKVQRNYHTQEMIDLSVLKLFLGEKDDDSYYDEQNYNRKIEFITEFQEHSKNSKKFSSTTYNSSFGLGYDYNAAGYPLNGSSVNVSSGLYPVPNATRMYHPAYNQHPINQNSLSGSTNPLNQNQAENYFSNHGNQENKIFNQNLFNDLIFSGLFRGNENLNACSSNELVVKDIDQFNSFNSYPKKLALSESTRNNVSSEKFGVGLSRSNINKWEGIQLRYSSPY